MASSLRRAAPLVVPAVGRHTATVIFAHGLGDSGAGWADVVEYWRARHSQLDGIKFVLPHAPTIAITLNYGMHMPGWFDVTILAPSLSQVVASRGLGEDAAGILASRDYLHGLVQDEVSAGIPADRVVLGGFSQGGAMSLVAGLSAPAKIAAIVALSAWLPLHQTFRSYIPDADVNRATPIFMGHGDRDAVVAHALGEFSADTLRKMGYDVTFKTYSGVEHSACPEELDAVGAFLAAKLPPKGA